MNKLVYITNVHMPTGRAYGNQIAKLCESFADFGVQVELVYLGNGNGPEASIYSYFGAKNNFSVRPIFFFDFSRLEKYIGKLSFYLQSISFLFKLFFIKIDKGALIYTRQPEIAWLMGLRGFTVYYEDHGAISRKSFLFLGYLKKVSGIVAINGFIKNEFIKNGINPDKILVAPSGVDLGNFNINISKEDAIKRLGLERELGADFINKKILMYTGNFRTKGVDKGIDEILKAMVLLEKTDLVFVAVGGSADEIDFYKQMAVDMKIGGQTHFLPRQSQDKLALFQKAADVLLMPFPKKAHYEYFMSPVKMFEYMVSGRPVIASNLPSITEVLNDKNALLVKAGDPADLAGGIKKILGDARFAKNLAAQALADVKKYSWQERVKKILNFMKNAKGN